MPEKRYDIDSLLDGVVTLPSMPDILAELNQRLADPDCPLSDVAEIVARDPGITFKTLRLVNSAYYGLSQEVKTIDHAVVLLGTKVIRNIVLTASVFETVRMTTQQFVRHCISCGVAMRTLARAGLLQNTVESPDEAFVFGLLHDIGKVILQEYLPEAVAEVALAVRRPMPWFCAEQEVIGVDHAAVGARLAEQWKLDPALVEAVAAHHELDRVDEEAAPLAAALCVADFLAGMAGLPSYDRPIYQIPEAVWGTLDIPIEDIPDVVEVFLDASPSISELVQLAA